MPRNDCARTTATELRRAAREPVFIVIQCNVARPLTPGVRLLSCCEPLGDHTMEKKAI
jgi:hypothetical protein